MSLVPDYENAALKSVETLIKYKVSFAPVDPLPILKSMRNVLVLSFTEMARQTGKDRKAIIDYFGEEGKDASTSVMMFNGEIKYLVGYNMRLPFYLTNRALARELGHIVLGHDGSRPEAVRTAEALCFAQHFLCPRALVRSLEDARIPLTVEMVGNVTGCYERCLAKMHDTPGVNVPPELNRKIKAQFADYVSNFADVQKVLQNDDVSPPADFGTYMDGYRE